MALEAGDFIPDLNANNPLGADPKSEGDDHIRLVKRCTQGSFPAFVGTLATPKSVSLTEDQISDAAQKSAAQNISGEWTHSVPLIMANNVGLQGTDIGAGLHNMLNINTSDDLSIGSNTISLALRGLTEIRAIVSGALVGRWIPSSDGTLIVENRLGVEKLAGFRNPSFNQQNVAYTLQQSDEGSVVRKSSGATTDYTVPQLEVLTAITVINDDTNSTLGLLAGSGVTIEAILGGSRLTAPLTLASDSVVQLYWVTTTLVKVWGNGIS